MKAWLESALVAAIISATISGLISVIGANVVDSRSKIRQTRIEQTLKFSTGNDQLFIVSQGYIKDIITSSDTKRDAETVHAEIGRQIRAAEDLKITFHDKEVDDAISAYEKSLTSYGDTIKEAVDPTKMKDWLERLGQVHDKQIELTNRLMKNV
ncbi:MAG: hypothetical protein JO001_26400 [Alphaproteobacteria bacterium]|nr:hypothetical protein [Alphaproteobacteria bacterium]